MAPVSENRIDYEFTDVPLPLALNYLIKQYRVPILFRAKQMKATRVTAECKGCSPATAIETLLDGSHFRAQRVTNNFLIKNVSHGEVRGQVLLRGNNYSLPNVRVVLSSGSDSFTPKLAYTDGEGKYEFADIPLGDYIVSVEPGQLVKSRPFPVSLDASGECFETIYVDQLGVSFQEIVVKKNSRATYQGIEPNVHVMERNGINRIPRGGDDALQVAALKPGVVNAEPQGSIRVNGLEPRVYLDGAEIIAPTHYRAQRSGRSGMIDSDIIDRMELMSGTFPVEYGDGVGGILAMTTTAPSKKLETSVTTTMLNTKVRTAGTFDQKRGQYFINLREGYWDIGDRFRRVPRNPRADKDSRNQDFMGKIQYNINDTHILSAHVLQGRSDYTYSLEHTLQGESEDYSASGEHSRYSWINLKSFWTRKLWSETVLSSSYYDSSLDYSSDLSGYYFREVADHRNYKIHNLRQDWNYEGFSHHRLKFGWKLKRSWADYHFKERLEVGEHLGDSLEESAADQTANLHSRDLGFYVADRMQLGPKWEAEAALRYDQQSRTEDSQWSPRLSLNYDHSQRTTGKIGWGRMHQSLAVHQLEIRSGYTSQSPTEAAEHFYLGLDHRFSTGIVFRGEVYNRKYEGLRLPKDFIFDSVTRSSGVNPLDPRLGGRSRGLELTVHSNSESNATWSVNYAMAKAVDIVNGQRVPSAWHQEHTVNAIFNYNYENRFDINLAWQWHTGWPTTKIYMDYVENGGVMEPVVVYGQPNGDRLPNYHRLDLRLNQLVKLSKGRSFNWFLEITNILNRENITSYDYRLTYDLQGNPNLEQQSREWSPFFPMMGMRWQF